MRDFFPEALKDVDRDLLAIHETYLWRKWAAFRQCGVCHEFHQPYREFCPKEEEWS